MATKARRSSSSAEASAKRRKAAMGSQSLKLYNWTGRDKSGKTIQGEMRASSESLVNTALRRQGIVVTRVKKMRMARGKPITEKDITLFTRQLATMMRSGVPLLQALDIGIRGTNNPTFAQMLNDIRTDVESGLSLSDAFGNHPGQFDRLFVNLVAAGEQAGILDNLLDRLATYKEKILALKSKIKSALFYPIAVIAVAAVVIGVMMIFVVPAFKDVFSSFGADLPAPTLVVIAISDFFVANWFIIVAIVAGLIFGTSYFVKRSDAAKNFFDRLLLRLPVLGDVIRKATVARWARTLSTMFSAGVPLVEALDSVGGASGNRVYEQATKAVQNDVSVGVSLNVAMQNTSVFPIMIVQMTAIGEESGQLDSMLSKSADFYEQEVDDAVGALSTLIEPIIMVFLGVVIGGLVVAMYLPIFKLGSAIG